MHVEPSAARRAGGGGADPAAGSGDDGAGGVWSMPVILPWRDCAGRSTGGRLTCCSGTDSEGAFECPWPARAARWSVSSVACAGWPLLSSLGRSDDSVDAPVLGRAARCSPSPSSARHLLVSGARSGCGCSSACALPAAGLVGGRGAARPRPPTTVSSTRSSASWSLALGRARASVRSRARPNARRATPAEHPSAPARGNQSANWSRWASLEDSDRPEGAPVGPLIDRWR